MTTKDPSLQYVTHAKFRELIRCGQEAIEHRMLDILLRPPWTGKDNAEMEEVNALLVRYKHLMDEKYWYRPPEAANDSDGAEG